MWRHSADGRVVSVHSEDLPRRTKSYRPGRIKAAGLAKVNEFVRDAIRDGCIVRSIMPTGLGDVRSGIQRMT